jgi:hypothetical protein
MTLKAVATTEWQLQEQLTGCWNADGILLPSGELLQLVAWEVMPSSWEVNDALHHWGSPAVDFVAVDQTHRPVAIELKRRLTGPLHTWRAVCQVTHLTLALAASANVKKVDRVRGACRSGRHGRMSSGSVATDHDLSLNLQAGWRRMVAAPVVDEDQVRAAAARLGNAPIAAARTWLEGRLPTRADVPVRRLADMKAAGEPLLTGDVESFRVPS